MSETTKSPKGRTETLADNAHRYTAPLRYEDGEVVTVEWEDDSYWVARLEGETAIGTHSDSQTAALCDLIIAQKGVFNTLIDASAPSEGIERAARTLVRNMWGVDGTVWFKAEDLQALVKAIREADHA